MKAILKLPYILLNRINAIKISILWCIEILKDIDKLIDFIDENITIINVAFDYTLNDNGKYILNIDRGELIFLKKTLNSLKKEIYLDGLLFNIVTYKRICEAIIEIHHHLHKFNKSHTSVYHYTNRDYYDEYLLMSIERMKIKIEEVKVSWKKI